MFNLPMHIFASFWLHEFGLPLPLLYVHLVFMHKSKQRAGKPIKRLKVNKLTFIINRSKAGTLLSNFVWLNVSFMLVKPLSLFSQVYGEYRASLAFDLVSSRQKNVSESSLPDLKILWL